MCPAKESPPDKPALLEQFKTYPTRFPIDFSPEFLANQPLERLRHIFLAMCLQNQRLPQLTPAA
jgi:hypothetical protein